MANKTKAELLNIIAGLRRTMDDVQASRAEKLNEIDRLRDEMHASSDVLDEKSNEIKELERKLKIFSDGITMRDEWHDDYTNEIKDLKVVVQAGDTLIGKQANQIKRLRGMELSASSPLTPVAPLDSQYAATAIVLPSSLNATVLPKWSPPSAFEGLTYACCAQFAPPPVKT